MPVRTKLVVVFTSAAFSSSRPAWPPHAEARTTRAASGAPKRERAKKGTLRILVSDICETPGWGGTCRTAIATARLQWRLRLRLHYGGYESYFGAKGSRELVWAPNHLRAGAAAP